MLDFRSDYHGANGVGLLEIMRPVTVTSKEINGYGG